MNSSVLVHSQCLLRHFSKGGIVDFWESECVCGNVRPKGGGHLL